MDPTQTNGTYHCLPSLSLFLLLGSRMLTRRLLHLSAHTVHYPFSLVLLHLLSYHVPSLVRSPFAFMVRVPFPFPSKFRSLLLGSVLCADAILLLSARTDSVVSSLLRFYPLSPAFGGASIASPR